MAHLRLRQHLHAGHVERCSHVGLLLQAVLLPLLGENQGIDQLIEQLDLGLTRVGRGVTAQGVESQYLHVVDVLAIDGHQGLRLVAVGFPLFGRDRSGGEAHGQQTRQQQRFDLHSWFFHSGSTFLKGWMVTFS